VTSLVVYTEARGHEHGGQAAEYARLCFKGHVRLGRLCGPCAGPADGHGLRRVECGDCPPGSAAVLVPIREWERFLAAEVADAEAEAAAELQRQFIGEPGQDPEPFTGLLDALGGGGLVLPDVAGWRDEQA
jgi:hypothetical protein